MLDFIKKLFGFNPPVVAEPAKVETAPYKVPEPVAITPIPLEVKSVVEAKPVKAAAKPKAPAKPRAPRKPKASA